MALINVKIREDLEGIKLIYEDLINFHNSRDLSRFSKMIQVLRWRWHRLGLSTYMVSMYVKLEHAVSCGGEWTISADIVHHMAGSGKQNHRWYIPVMINLCGWWKLGVLLISTQQFYGNSLHVSSWSCDPFSFNLRINNSYHTPPVVCSLHTKLSLHEASSGCPRLGYVPQN